MPEHRYMYYLFIALVPGEPNQLLPRSIKLLGDVNREEIPEGHN